MVHQARWNNYSSVGGIAMEWSRVKSILICVFVVVNLILLKVYIDGNNSQITVDEATLNSTAKVLAGKNIIVDTKDIPDKVSDVSIFNITNKYKSVSDYATVLHENAKAEGLDYFNPDSTVVNDGVLTYKGKAAPLKNVRKGLKKIGALNSYNYKCTQTDNTILYNVLYDGLCVNDTYLSATVDDDTLTITLSNWLADSYKNTGFSSVRTAPEALISFSNSVSFEQPFKITSVTQGYLAGSRNGEIQTSTAAPVWKISGENGINYYVDMRNGDFLKND